MRQNDGLTARLHASPRDASPVSHVHAQVRENAYHDLRRNALVTTRDRVRVRNEARTLRAFPALMARILRRAGRAS